MTDRLISRFRILAAFAITPLVVPLLFAALFGFGQHAGLSFGLRVLELVALLAYPVTLLIAIPSYLFLRSKRWMGAGHFAIVGLIGGTMVGLILRLFMPHAPVGGFFVLIGEALLGVVTALMFWCIGLAGLSRRAEVIQ